jgi:hypothetical protein
MPRTPLRIAVLECDTPPESSNAKYGGYVGVFRTLLHSSVRELYKPEQIDPSSILEISRFDVVTAQNYPDLESVDAVLLTGSSMPTSCYILHT